MNIRSVVYNLCPVSTSCPCGYYNESSIGSIPFPRLAFAAEGHRGFPLFLAIPMSAGPLSDDSCRQSRLPSFGPPVCMQHQQQLNSPGWAAAECRQRIVNENPSAVAETPKNGGDARTQCWCHGIENSVV